MSSSLLSIMTSLSSFVRPPRLGLSLRLCFAPSRLTLASMKAPEMRINSVWAWTERSRFDNKVVACPTAASAWCGERRRWKDLATKAMYCAGSFIIDSGINDSKASLSRPAALRSARNLSCRIEKSSNLPMLSGSSKKENPTRPVANRLTKSPTTSLEVSLFPFASATRRSCCDLYVRLYSSRVRCRACTDTLNSDDVRKKNSVAPE
mmetsp:Transcript_3453/g.8114  ORF Transcript_3453/g.8114 Transcript_3453/m.8114 type:complete len:207 (+) Transcript_3453:405-1025(+)